MSLTDIMSHSNLAVFPQIALILFLAVFASVSASVFLSRHRRGEYDRAAMLPLEDDDGTPPLTTSESDRS